jgi:CHAT domain-containing protein
VLLVRLASLDLMHGQASSAADGLRLAQEYFVTLGETEPMIATELGLAALDEASGDLAAAATHAETALRVAQQSQLGRWIARSATMTLRLQLARGQAPAESPLLSSITAHYDRLTRDEQAAALVVQGRLEEAHGRAAAAAPLYERAIERLELLRVDPLAQDAFYDAGARFEPYEHLIALAVKQQDPDAAIRHLYRSRRKELLQAHDPSNFSSTRPDLQEPLAALRTRHARIQGLTAAVARLRSTGTADAAVLTKTEEDLHAAIAEWRALGEKVINIEPAYRAYVEDDPPSLRQVQQQLPPRTALIIYTAPLDAELQILVVTPDAATFHRSPMPPQQIWRSTGEALDALAADRPTLDSAHAPLIALHGALIAPIGTRLASVDRLVILPTRRLHYLPFQALATRTPKGVRYLIEDKEVVTISGAAIARLGREPRSVAAGPTHVSLFGNATADLPAAEEEVARIAKIFPASTAFTRSSATPASVRRASAVSTVLHFAVHGQLRAGLPSSSHLRLAPATSAGHLTVSEIRTLPLEKADLVTLSACVSSLGQGDPRGIAASSLSDAFLAAGAASVVGTLWYVDDESTRDLMAAFYKELAGGACKGAALRSAQLSLLRRPNRSHPYYWSAFQLTGDAGPLPGGSSTCSTSTK